MLHIHCIEDKKLFFNIERTLISYGQFKQKPTKNIKYLESGLQLVLNRAFLPWHVASLSLLQQVMIFSQAVQKQRQTIKFIEK